MAHPFFENGRIQAGLPPDQYHEEFKRQAEVSDSNLNAEAQVVFKEPKAKVRTKIDSSPG